MRVRRAEIKAFDSGTHTATVQMAGSLSVWLSSVPVARNIGAAEVIVGRKCALIFFDDTNPDDAVIVAVYT